MLNQKRIELENQVKFSKIDGFFPTPKDVFSRMVDLLSYEVRTSNGENLNFLEPSAGSGSLADAICEQWPESQLNTIETNSTLCELLELKGYAPLHDDFLEVRGLDFNDDEKQDVIFMNPPFEKQQDCDHVREAYAWLNDGGELVAVMSSSSIFIHSTKASCFKAWLERVGGEVHELPENSFKESGTGVNTVLVKINK